MIVVFYFVINITLRLLNVDHTKEHIDIVTLHIVLSDYLYVYENNRDNLMYVMVRNGNV